MLKELAGQIFAFDGKILGFPELSKFELSIIDEMGVYGLLQSLEEEEIGFVVTDPFRFFPNYEFELSQADKDEIKLDSHEDALVLAIITLHNPFQQSTINLLAPLVINLSNRQGKQIVLSSKYDYQTKTLLIPQEKGV